jgi:BspA type Leucine rich repeat region (6 copies)
MTRIEEGFAFADCATPRRVRLPGRTVAAIGRGAFRGCSSLVDVSIPARLAVIAESTFFGCESLGRIHIPANVTAIHESAFDGCESLTDITFAPDGECRLAYLGKCFVGSVGGSVRGNGKLETIALPPSVTDVHLDAFRHFSGRILLPRGRSDVPPPMNEPGYPELTLAFVLLQRAGVQSGLPVHRMLGGGDGFMSRP